MLTLKSLLNVEKKVSITGLTTVYDVKKQLSDSIKISPKRIILFYSGKELDNDKLISSYNIPQNAQVLYIIEQRNIQQDLTSFLNSEVPDCMRNMIKFRGDSMNLVYIFSKIVYSDKIRYPQKRRPTDPLNFEYLIQKLKVLGYSEQRIANALRRTDYNVELAAAVLFEDLDFAQQIEEIIDISNLMETFSSIGDDEIDDFHDLTRKQGPNGDDALKNDLLLNEEYVLTMPSKTSIDLTDIEGLSLGSSDLLLEPVKEESSVTSPRWDFTERLSTRTTPISSRKVNAVTPSPPTAQARRSQRRATTFLPVLNNTQPPKEKPRRASIQSSRNKTASSVPVLSTQQNQQRTRRLSIRKPSLNSQRANI